MRTITQTLLALGFVGATAVSTPIATKAQGIYFSGPGIGVEIGNRPYRYGYDRYDRYHRYNSYYGSQYYGGQYYGGQPYAGQYYRGPTEQWNTWQPQPEGGPNVR